MRVIVQQVSEAAVRVDGRNTGRVSKGLLVLAGFEDADDARKSGRIYFKYAWD
jgi:D-tyrosyl-tRNA(Tyr) deacylase